MEKVSTSEHACCRLSPDSGRWSDREMFLENSPFISINAYDEMIYLFFHKKSRENLPTGLTSRYTSMK